MERLQKFIASSGYTSRRKAEELIKDGKVMVNGNVIKELGIKVSESDSVIVEGKPISKSQKEYYLLNKPGGYICSLDDEHDRKIVTELIDTDVRIFPIGRLDYDTTGLLILTNDGDLANKLMHPSHNVAKKYVAKLEGILSMEELFKLKNGILIEERKCKPLRVKIKSKNEDKKVCIVEITIVEGRKHIVKKLFEQVGHTVIKLKREEYGPLSLGNLKSGEYRPLTKSEIKVLKSI